MENTVNYALVEKTKNIQSLQNEIIKKYMETPNPLYEEYLKVIGLFSTLDTPMINQNVIDYAVNIIPGLNNLKENPENAQELLKMASKLGLAEKEKVLTLR